MRKPIWRYRPPATPAKRRRFDVSILAAVIGLVGVLIGTFIGQRMNATTESDKTIRAKLEEAYFRTQMVVGLAENLNMVATDGISPSTLTFRGAQYNAALLRYQEEVSKLVAVSDLYEVSLSEASKRLVTCSRRFSGAVGTHFLVVAGTSGGAKVAGAAQEALARVDIPQSLNELVAIRLECQSLGDQLRETIATTMKRHL